MNLPPFIKQASGPFWRWKEERGRRVGRLALLQLCLLSMVKIDKERLLLAEMVRQNGGSAGASSSSPNSFVAFVLCLCHRLPLFNSAEVRAARRQSCCRRRCLHCTLRFRSPCPLLAVGLGMEEKRGFMVIGDGCC